MNHLWVCCGILLCAAWVYSYFYWDLVGYSWKADWYYVRLERGRVQISQFFPARSDVQYDRSGHGRIWPTPVLAASDPQSIQFAGFMYRRSEKTDELIRYDATGHLVLQDQFFTAIAIPLWFPVVLGVLPLSAIIRQKRRRRRVSNEGFCRKCGYDLRASPARCPECGLLVAGVVLET